MAQGGGLALEDCDVAANEIVLSENLSRATGEGIAILGTGGGINIVRSTFALSNVRVVANRIEFEHFATGAYGGAVGAGIHIRQADGAIRDSTISDNVIDGDTITTSPIGVGAGVGVDTELGRTSSVRVTGSTISSNTTSLEATTGGALAIGGGVFLGSAFFGAGPANLVIENSTISANRLLQASPNVLNVGGGVGVNDADASRQLRLIHVTIADNEASGEGPQAYGGGIGTLGPAPDTVSLENAIVYGNRSSDPAVQNCGAPDASIRLRGSNIIGSYSLDECSVIFSSGDTELSLSDPELGALDDNGGATKTHAIALGSLAANQAHPATCVDAEGAALTTDQRGMGRSDCDIGAFEAQ